MLAAIVCQSCYTRIGDLNMASNRNIESTVNYVLKEKYVAAKGKSKTGDALEVALDNAVKKMMEVSSYSCVCKSPVV